MLYSMNDKMNDVSQIYWVFNENDVNDDARGSCFNLSTVQTKVRHLDWAVNRGHCWQTKSNKNLYSP